MVIVFHARVWDQQAGDHIITPHKWTEEKIGQMGGATPLYDTAQEVDVEELDDNGRYLPKDAS